MIQESFIDESELTDEERRFDTLAVQTVLGIVLLLVVVFWLGIHIGTQKATQHCTDAIAKGEKR